MDNILTEKQADPRRIAFFGGSFDPVHVGHIGTAEWLVSFFHLDEFYFIPAFHAPHKPHRQPTPGYDRYAMLSLATNEWARLKVSRIEIENPRKPYTIQTIRRLKKIYPDDIIFFVMGADSWMDIRTWRDWEKLLTMTNHIVVTRPGYEIKADHVTPKIWERIIDLRGEDDGEHILDTNMIYFVQGRSLDISATELRRMVRVGDHEWRYKVPDGVANYIEKYQIYK